MKKIYKVLRIKTIWSKDRDGGMESGPLRFMFLWLWLLWFIQTPKAWKLTTLVRAHALLSPSKPGPFSIFLDNFEIFSFNFGYLI